MRGSKNRSSGAQGEDVYLDVPLGTVVKDTETEEVLFEITEKDQEVILVKGGLGGRGNWHFKSSTRQTPRYAQPGMKGVQRFVTLELKLLADVGLVGFPNAGKSTLLAALTSAKPKIADYEFTTLKPNLGIVHYRDYRSFVMADIPGIIEGAAQGKGLGHYFLRHIERNSVLLYVIPADAKDVKKQFEILRSELQEFNPELLDKQYMVVLSKCDLLDDELREAYAEEMKASFPHTPHTMISAISEYNLQSLKDELWKVLALENSIA